MAELQDENGIIQTLFSKALDEIQQHPIAAISGIVTIVIGLAAFTKTGRTILRVGINWAFEKARPSVPTQTLRIVPNDHERWWHMGKSNDQPAMQVVTSVHVTNVTDMPVRILSATIKPTNTTGHVMVRHNENNIYGGYSILPNSTTMAHIDFWIQPPVKRPKEDFKGTIILFDQYGNRHKIKKITFLSDATRQSNKTAPSVPEESVQTLKDPTEKEIVSILKNEVNRYKNCGRRAGGLGSIHTILEGRTYSGVPTDWRKADSHEQQDIIEDINQVSIESDNFKSIQNVFSRIETDEEKSKAAEVLVTRLRKDTEYSPIGYFIWLVLFKYGYQTQALTRAKEALQGDSKYGFSDMLRLIDGWLRFAHVDFSEKDLDDIEVFLEGVDEHLFRIRERITAIGSYRIAKSK